jgi:hypothetical protein
VDEQEIVARRMHNQHLAGDPLPNPVAVVRHLGAVQAQECAVAKWSVAQRCTGVDDLAMQQAIDDGRILRVHALRPTWHFVAAEDLAWIQAATGPRVHAVNAYYNRQHGIDDELAGKARKVMGEVLRDGNHLTRAELGQALAAGGVDATGSRLAYVIMGAELDGVLCNGAMRGKQHTYALVSERTPEVPELTPDAALAELTLRYFTGHGPATVKDFAWWSSLTLAQIRRGLLLTGEALTSATVGGRTYWYAPEQPPPPAPSPTAHALQGYDEYVVAYTESRPLLNLAGLDLGVGNENLLIHPVLLDGQLIGSWRRAAGPTQITATLSLRIEPTRAQRAALVAAFDRYSAYAGVPVLLE